jgi:hypothetical protein
VVRKETTKMNEQVAEDWVIALRSGTYQQGQAALLDPKGNFCCLGVLCKISNLGEFNFDLGTSGTYKTAKDHNAGFPPPSVSEWAGISKKSSNDLAAMNDRNSSFAAIADHIEQNWETL